MTSAVLAAHRRVLCNGRSTLWSAAAKPVICAPFLTSGAQERTGAAHNRVVMISGTRPWRRRRAAVQPEGHNGPDWSNAVVLQNLECLVALGIPSSVSDLVHTRSGTWPQTNRRSSDRVCAPGGLAIYRDDVSIT